ncbi:RNA polymerase sigma factor [Chitinophaga cymbidii]|nr:sigma-70 family RNA polymerase sigma factor [Chitinophaga cymbidii]
MNEECTTMNGSGLTDEEFKVLYFRFREALIVEAFRILRDGHEAEDVVQETFIKLWENNYLKDVNPGAIRSYLYSAVKNNCLTRKSARESAERKKGHFMEVHGGEVAADQTEIWELRERLNEAIQSLPSQRRWAFVKTYMDDKSYREAGQEMGLTMETVKSHVKVALKNLRISLSGLR